MEWVNADKNGDGYGGVEKDEPKEAFNFIGKGNHYGRPDDLKLHFAGEETHQDFDNLIYRKLKKIICENDGNIKKGGQFNWLNEAALSPSGINVKNWKEKPFMVWCTKKFTDIESQFNSKSVFIIKRILLFNYEMPYLNRYIDFFEKIINLGGDVNAKNRHGRTPIFYARCSILHLLLKHGARVNVFGDDGCTPLIRLCWDMSYWNWEDDFKDLLGAGADISARGSDNGSALSYVLQVYCRSPHLKDLVSIIKMFVERGAKITQVEINAAKQCDDEGEMENYLLVARNKQWNTDKENKTKKLACLLAFSKNPKPKKNLFDCKIFFKKWYEN